MVKIKFIKETEVYKKGQIIDATKEQAEEIISEGYAEYYKEKPKKAITPEKNVKKDLIEKIDEVNKEKGIMEEEPAELFTRRGQARETGETTEERKLI